MKRVQLYSILNRVSAGNLGPAQAQELLDQMLDANEALIRERHEARVSELLEHTTKLELERREETARADGNEKALLALTEVSSRLAMIAMGKKAW